MSPGHWVGEGGASLESPCQWWGLSLRPLHVLLCVCPLLRAQCRVAGAGVAPRSLDWASIPAGRAILQPLVGGRGVGSRGCLGFSRGLNLPPLSPQKAPGCTSASEIFPEGGSTSSERPVPGPARLCSGPRGTCRGGACPSNLGLCFSSSRDPRDLSPQDPSAA